MPNEVTQIYNAVKKELEDKYGEKNCQQTTFMYWIATKLNFAERK